MTRLEDHDDWILIQKLNNGVPTNLFEWAKRIVDKFCGEETIEEHI